MRQCYVCGDIIIEPVSAYARNICRRCASAPPQTPSETQPAVASDARERQKLPEEITRIRPAAKPREVNLQFLRGATCLSVGISIIAYNVWVILFGGVLHWLGGGLALLIVGMLDLYYWLMD